jgi:hypothetical protein
MMIVTTMVIYDHHSWPIYTSDFRVRFCIKLVHFREQKIIACIGNLWLVIGSKCRLETNRWADANRGSNFISHILDLDN